MPTSTRSLRYRSGPGTYPSPTALGDRYLLPASPETQLAISCGPLALRSLLGKQLIVEGDDPRLEHRYR
jgi:hypothetical protein